MDGHGLVCHTPCNPSILLESIPYHWAGVWSSSKGSIEKVTFAQVGIIRNNTHMCQPLVPAQKKDFGLLVWKKQQHNTWQKHNGSGCNTWLLACIKLVRDQLALLCVRSWSLWYSLLNVLSVQCYDGWLGGCWQNYSPIPTSIPSLSIPSISFSLPFVSLSLPSHISQKSPDSSSHVGDAIHPVVLQEQGGWPVRLGCVYVSYFVFQVHVWPVGTWEGLLWAEVFHPGKCTNGMWKLLFLVTLLLE